MEKRDLLESITSLHKIQINPPFGLHLHIPRLQQQLTLFDPDEGLINLLKNSNGKKIQNKLLNRARNILGQRLANATGEFYEWLTVFFHGGRRVERPFYIPDPANGQLSLEELCLNNEEIERNNGIYGRPDVVDEKTNLIWESKGCGKDQRCILFDKQIDVYSSLQVRKPDFNIYYTIYIHGVEGIKSEPQNKLETLFKDLADNTMYGLVLPLSLIRELHDPKKTYLRNRGVYRYVADDRDRQELGFLPKDYTSITKTTKLSIIEDPYKALKNLNIDSDSYHFYRLLSPSSFYVNGHALKQFPILKIDDKNHFDWVRNFRFDYLRELGIEDGKINDQLGMIDAAPGLEIPYLRELYPKPVYPREDDPNYKETVMAELDAKGHIDDVPF